MTRKEQAAEVVDRLLGPRDLAEWFDVPLQTIYTWQHRGVGPPLVQGWTASQVETAGLRDLASAAGQSRPAGRLMPGNDEGPLSGADARLSLDARLLRAGGYG